MGEDIKLDEANQSIVMDRPSPHPHTTPPPPCIGPKANSPRFRIWKRRMGGKANGRCQVPANRSASGYRRRRRWEF